MPTQPKNPSPRETPEDPSSAPDLVVEAALFSAGQPMSVDEIVEQTHLPPDTVEDGLEDLVDCYNDRRTSLEVKRSGDKYALVLRDPFADASRHIVPPEIPLHLLRTLALVAYHQPMLQSDLGDMIGSKVYAHVGKLVDLGLIEKEREGVTYALTTTSQFPEYFGIPSDEPDTIREYLAEKVGLISDGSAPQTETTDVRDAPPVPGTQPKQ
jgi:segregation and condensation protein B